MKKLRLDVEELAVESFRTEAGEGEGRGTVRGREWWAAAEPVAGVGGTDVSTCDPKQACGCADSWEGSCDCG